MSETPPYFYNPFGVDADDLATVPVTGSGSPTEAVNYQYGFTDCYEYNIITNPAARPMARGVMNQLLFDITTLCQQYSQYGVPLFITTSQNQGTPFAYPIYARTYYGGVVYENQVAGNTATPGTDNTWLVISGDATGVLTGTVLDYAGNSAPGGYLSCDGSAVSRTTYAALYDVISQAQTGTTTNTLNTVTGLSSTANLYVGMSLECANFAPGTTVASITSSSSITASTNATGSGSVAIRFFNWGNGDGSTTFNVPDLRRDTTIGQGGTSSGTPFGVAGTVVGQSGGQEAHTQTIAELASHNHPLASGSGVGIAQVVTTNNNTSGPVTGTTGSSTPFNVMQPSTVVYKIIKT